MSGMGKTLSDFTSPPAPDVPDIDGIWVRLERLDPERHAEPIFNAVRDADHVWDYLPNGPFPDLEAYRDWQAQVAAPSDPCFYAIMDPQTGQAAGVASFIRIDRANGVIEIGNIMLSPALQRSRTASAALMAMIRWAFEAGYRRVEWKCNALNAPSRRAALRFGFRFEGEFRQHMIVKGRNRDTAWFSIIDDEWPALDAAYRQWLAASNFDAEGRQLRNLSSLTEQALPGRRDDPGRR
ncbi:GNAT family N-acetyltransferase [Paracoccus methylarcula]|uniref:N-acetyltransferase n=1 Tax=Paracoccus methylarcula TaxID=72022 RepID=A0A422R1R4_9RHOB|nr:GNAT family protein [Paracoccus methylarcula]RNF36121.1 N-acetyltransferase [Paracoccus methylarcula]